MIEQIKKHIYENRKVYIVAGVSLLVGIMIGGVTVFVLKKSLGNKVIIDSFNLIKYKSPHTSQTIMQVVLPYLGHPGNALQCIETGTIYASQGQAAKELGVNPSTIRKVLNGLQEDIRGLHFTKLTEAGVPIAE